MQRATLVEKKELSRIGKLYERFNYVNKPKGNGNTTCIVCGSLFNTFKTTPRICNMCLKVTILKLFKNKIRIIYPNYFYY